MTTSRFRSRFVSFFSLLPILALALVPKGCPLIPPIPAAPQFAYVANSSSNNISAYTVNASTGALTQVSGSPFATGDAGPAPVGAAPNSVAVDPSGKFVYVTNSNSYTVSAFTIDSNTGALTAVPGSPFAASNLPYAVTVDPLDRFAYVVTDFGDIWVFTINASTGALAPVYHAETADDLVSVAADPSGKFVYIADEYASEVRAYAIDASTGTLTAVPGSPFAAGRSTNSVAVDPKGQFVYATSGDVNCGSGTCSGLVWGFAIDASTGALTAVPGASFATPTVTTSGLTIDPAGKFAYVANGNSDEVTAYSINASTGDLTPVPGSPFTTPSPSSVTVDPSGKFAYVTNSGSNTVSAYAIAADGALTQVSQSPFPAGTGPVAMAITGESQ